ncbi:MAG: hypothetical protein DRN40_06040, partial [Thermoplasmata archaeon]
MFGKGDGEVGTAAMLIHLCIAVSLLVPVLNAGSASGQDDRTVFTDASGDVFSVKEATSVIFGHFIDITRVERWVEDG